MAEQRQTLTFEAAAIVHDVAQRAETLDHSEQAKLRDANLQGENLAAEYEGGFKNQTNCCRLNARSSDDHKAIPNKVFNNLPRP